MSSQFEEERERVIQDALRNPRPCLVCDSLIVVGIGTWIPDDRYYLAAGGNDYVTPVFGFWVCKQHGDITDENDKLIRQAILRLVRSGNSKTL